MTNLSSGIKDITLSSLANLRSLKTITDVPAVGISEDTTMTLSNIFQPSLKKIYFIFSAKNLINISNTKKTVMKISKILSVLMNRSSVKL